MKELLVALGILLFNSRFTFTRYQHLFFHWEEDEKKQRRIERNRSRLRLPEVQCQGVYRHWILLLLLSFIFLAGNTHVISTTSSLACQSLYSLLPRSWGKACPHWKPRLWMTQRQLWALPGHWACRSTRSKPMAVLHHRTVAWCRGDLDLLPKPLLSLKKIVVLESAVKFKFWLHNHISFEKTIKTRRHLHIFQ